MKIKTKRLGIVLLIILAIVVFTSSVFAHDHPIYFAEDVYLDADVLEGDPLLAKVAYKVWGFHDHIHWIVIILMLFSCYHFRWFSGKKFGHPKQCFEVDKDYTGERELHKYHRLFWWGNLVLIGIHWTEVITGWQYGFDYTYTFSNQTLGILAEGFYVVSFTLWLFSCHFLRYFLGGSSSNYSKCGMCALRGKVYHANSKFNTWHGFFMWMAIASMVLLIAMQGHL